MHCKGYLKASSQKYCKQQATGSRLRSQALRGPAGKSCHRLCGVQICSGWYTSSLKRWAAEYSKQVKSWLKKKKTEKNPVICLPGEFLFIVIERAWRGGWVGHSMLTIRAQVDPWNLEINQNETPSLPTKVICGGSPWRSSNLWVH